MKGLKSGANDGPQTCGCQQASKESFEIPDP